jgi:hypothetical protein
VCDDGQRQAIPSRLVGARGVFTSTVSICYVKGMFLPRKKKQGKRATRRGIAVAWGSSWMVRDDIKYENTEQAISQQTKNQRRYIHESSRKEEKKRKRITVRHLMRSAVKDRVGDPMHTRRKREEWLQDA